MKHKAQGRRTPEATVIRPGSARPRSRATIAVDAEVDQAIDQPFAGGAMDELDPDLRHRLISEAAFQRYAERGYGDGYDRDDWLDAEAQVDHIIIAPKA